jgi:succinyl-diaminopimelate desuccinylase
MAGQSEILVTSAPIEVLVQQIVDIPSPSGEEGPLADAIESALLDASHLEVLRIGNTVAARTSLNRDHRVVWAGHIDTVPVGKNLPSILSEGSLRGRGTVDMKGGVAIGLALALELSEPHHDVTWIFYDNEEVDATKNGLGLLGAAHPDWVTGDFAIVGEPSNSAIEGGCNGTLRALVETTGKQAHSARSWKGDNAIHAVAEVLERLATYQPSTVTVDGLDYREGLNAVGISGGVAGNVIPDACEVTINYRFAPNKTVEDAEAHVRSVFQGFSLRVVDRAGGARPGIDSELAQGFLSSLGVEVRPKYGWTDVARFGEWGIPAVNFGPGDPSLAHSDDEEVSLADVRSVYEGLKAWLGRSPA